MKRLTMLLMLMIAVIFAQPLSAQALYPYADVGKKSSHYEAIHYLQKEGMIVGYRYDKVHLQFKPNEALTRTEAAAVFYRILGLEHPEDYETILKD